MWYPELKVIPGGQTIGVKMKSDGVLVVGHHKLTTKDNQKVSPGEEADIRVGDRIISINGKKLTDIAMVAKLTAEAGKSGETLRLTIKTGQRNDRTRTEAGPRRAWRRLIGLACTFVILRPASAH